MNFHNCSLTRLNSRLVIGLLILVSFFAGHCYALETSPTLQPIPGTDQYFSSWKDSGNGIVSKDNQIILEPIYNNVFYLGENRFATRRFIAGGIEERLLMDEKGKVLAHLPPWADVSSKKYSCGMFNEGNGNEHCSYIDLKGTTIVQDGYYRFGNDYSCNLASVQIFKHGELYSAYLDKKGKIAIGPFREAECESFYKDKAIVKIQTKDGAKKSGVLSKNGTYIIPPIYDDIRRINEEFHPAIKQKNTFAKYQDEFLLINFPTKFARANVPSIIDTDTLIPFEKAHQAGETPGQEWGFCDLTGKVVIEPQFSSASAFQDSVASVGVREQQTQKELIGKIDRSGNWITKPIDQSTANKQWTNSWNKRERFREILNNHCLIGMGQAERESFFGVGESVSTDSLHPDFAQRIISYLIGAGCTGSTHLLFALDAKGNVLGWRWMSTDGGKMPWIKEDVRALSLNYDTRGGAFLPVNAGKLLKEFQE